MLLSFLREEGQGLAEYALILAFVAVIVVLAVAIFGGAVGDLFTNIVAMFDA